MSDLEKAIFNQIMRETCCFITYSFSTLSKKGRKCPVCKANFTHVRRHVTLEHIPWYIYPKTSCLICELGFGQERFLKTLLLADFKLTSLVNYGQTK